MQVFHCPNKACQKIVFKNHSKYLPGGVDIEMRCFHCGEYVRIKSESNTIVKRFEVQRKKDD
ncbi:MAG: hypothetical protein KAT66_00705 [Candidatus Lokiarchaeota archaeon]|nr:hypothetical protein [Candidatus Lokiarchaeota archaeon]